MAVYFDGDTPDTSTYTYSWTGTPGASDSIKTARATIEPEFRTITQHGAPVPGWEPATLPGRTMLVALDEDERIIWGGMVLRRRANASPVVTLDLATLEAYFDRRYVGDRTFTQVDQALIVKGIIDDTVPTGIAFQVDAPPSGTKRDREYHDDEDKTTLSVLADLMGVEGGSESTVDLEWADESHTTITAIVRVRDRLGVASDLPEAVFEMPGPVVDFEYVEDYSAEHGANDVMTTSDGEGDARPSSLHQVAQELLDAGWAVFEYRFTPSTSVTETETLDSHAREKVTVMRTDSPSSPSTCTSTPPPASANSSTWATTSRPHSPPPGSPPRSAPTATPSPATCATSGSSGGRSTSTAAG